MSMLVYLTAHNILASGFVGAFLYCALLSLHRLYFHPLSQFPGPRLAALTKWYELYYDLFKDHGGHFMWQVQELHRRYGPIVRINPDELHIDDPEYFEVLYANNPTKRDKYPPAAHMVGTPLGTFGTVSHELHRKRRNGNSHFFSGRAIASAEPIFQENVQRLSNVFKACFQKKEVIELRLRCLAYTTDTVSQLTLGKAFGLQQDQRRAEEWLSTVRAVANFTPTVKQFPWLLDVAKWVPPWVNRCLSPELARLLQTHAVMNEEAGLFLTAHSDEKVSQEDQEPSEAPQTLFQCIVASKIPPSEKAQDRLAQEAFVVVVAGSETTSRVLSAAIFHLHANLPILERLRKEIDAAMPIADVIPSSKTLSENTYLSIVIKETLRISAPITSRTPVVPHTTLLYDSHLIPAHTPASLTIHDVLLDARVFPEPDRFWPERWLQTPGPLEKFFVPFGNGTRMCQGSRVAYAELYLALTVLIRRFEFRLYDTVRERDVDAVRDCFVGETHPASPGIRVEIVAIRD